MLKSEDGLNGLMAPIGGVFTSPVESEVGVAAWTAVSVMRIGEQRIATRQSVITTLERFMPTVTCRDQRTDLSLVEGRTTMGIFCYGPGGDLPRQLRTTARPVKRRVTQARPSTSRRHRPAYPR